MFHQVEVTGKGLIQELPGQQLSMLSIEEVPNQ
jgi:hypothetical protein